PLRLVRRAWFGRHDFVERFALFLQRGNAVADRDDHITIFGKLFFPANWSVAVFFVFFSSSDERHMSSFRLRLHQTIRQPWQTWPYRSLSLLHLLSMLQFCNARNIDRKARPLPVLL